MTIFSHLLLVSEEANCYYQLQQLLEKIETVNYHLTWTSLGSFQAEKKSVDAYDLILGDLATLGGIKTLSFWLDQFAAIPVIILTDDLQQGNQCLALGATDYLDKTSLNLFILEKSLRLSLACAQTKKQLQKAETITQQWQACYQETVQYYDSILDSLPQSIYRKDREGQFVYGNQAFLESLGENFANVLGKTAQDFYPPDLANQHHQEEQSILKTGTTFDTIEQHQLPSFSESRYLQIVKTPARNREGNIIGIQGIFWDVSDRLATEFALQDSEAEFRTFFEQTKVGMAKVSLSGDLLKINRSFAEFLGYTPEELLQKNFQQLTYPDDIDISITYFENLLSGETDNYILEKRYIHKNGKICWAKITSVLVKNSFDEPQYIITVIEDIEAEKQAKDALQSSELKYRSLVENLSDGVYLLDQDFQTRYLNIAIAEIVGYPLDYFLNHSLERFLACIHPDDRLEVSQRLSEITHSLELNYRIRRPDGEIRYIRDVMTVIYDNYGQIQGYQGIYCDLTEYKQTEANLRQSQQRLKLITDSLPVCIAYVNAQRQYEFANKTYETWLGWTAEEMIGKYVWEILGQKNYRRICPYLDQVLAGQETAFEWTMVDPSGQKRDLSAILVADHQDDQVVGYYVLVADISDRKRFEQQLCYRLALETALVSISQTLATDDPVDLTPILAYLGTATQVTRAYLVHFFNQGQTASMVSEWCQTGIQSDLANFQNQSMTHFPWWKRHLDHHQAIVIPDVDELPEAANVEKTYLQSIGVKSVLAVAIYDHQGQLCGQIGLDMTGTTTKNWSEQDIQLLQIVGEMIYRHQQRLEAKQQLKASEALYSGIFNHSAEAICLVQVHGDNHFVYETVNPIYESLTGMSVETIKGKTPDQVWSPEIANTILADYRRCIEFKTPLFYEKKIKINDIPQIWRTSLVPIPDSQGKVQKLLGSSRNITNEKRVIEQKLRYSRQMRLLATLTLKIRQSLDINDILQTTVVELKHTLQAQRVIIFRFFADGSGKIVNEASELAFPVMLNETLVDGCCWQQCHGKYSEGYIQICSDTLKADYAPCYLDFLQKYQIRSNVVFPILIAPKTEFSAVWGLLCVQMCDQPRIWTTEEIDIIGQLRDQLSIALAQAQSREREIAHQKELERSNKALEEFAYIVSHDLRQPLQIITDFAQLLERRYQGQLDAKADKFIHHIVNSSRRMDRQIEDLLHYSRVGRKSQPFDVVEISWVIEQALIHLRREIRQSQANLLIAEILPTIMGDPSQLIQLFQNLIGNAIKYRREINPIIEIEVKAQEVFWEFSVKDNGIGIDSQHYERIFQIFQRLHTETEYPGTGIGLAICQRIVHRHGGQIWVKSSENQGSTFYFTLPMLKTHSH